MSLKALWTKPAEASFGSILAYMEKEWGTLVADAFASDVAQTIAFLEVFPNGGVWEVRDKGIRSIPVARQVRLFYRIADDVLIVLELIDTRTERFQGIRG